MPHATAKPPEERAKIGRKTTPGNVMVQVQLSVEVVQAIDSLSNSGFWPHSRAEVIRGWILDGARRDVLKLKSIVQEEGRE